MIVPDIFLKNKRARAKRLAAGKKLGLYKSGRAGMFLCWGHLHGFDPTAERTIVDGCTRCEEKKRML